MPDRELNTRPLRADARRNRESVLRAAREAFAESGFDVPLDEIAARAGVGPGTVYRHFATKEALFQAVISARISGLTAAAQAGAGSDDPGSAFYAFLALVGEEAAVKRDLPDAFTVPGPLVADLHAAVGQLLERAQRRGAVRGDVTTAELMSLLKGLLAALAETSPPDPGRTAKFVTIVSDGLRPPEGGR